MKCSFWLLGSTTLTLALLASCETSKPAADVSASAGTSAATGRTSASAESMESNGIRLTPFADSPKFPEAQMQLRNPIAGATLPSGEVPFDYQVTEDDAGLREHHQARKIADYIAGMTDRYAIREHRRIFSLDEL